MSTTIRIDEADKERLRRLQEHWRRVHGRDVTQQEILGKGLAYLEAHRDDFLAVADWRPMSRAEARRRLRAMQGHFGRVLEEGETIDDVVYSREAVLGRVDE